MRDYERRGKDEYPKMIVMKDAPKVINPATGRLKYAEVINPDWEKGYKKGDRKGPGIIITTREPERLIVLMNDVLEVCDAIRNGHFYRSPGDICNHWCKYGEQCSTEIKMGINEEKIVNASIFASKDPFDD